MTSDQSPVTSKCQTMVLGFDGLGPELARVALAGTPLSVTPMKAEEPVTGPSWWTIYTGMTQDQHRIRCSWGISDLRIDWYRELVKSCWFAQAAAQGKRVLCWDLPAIWPAPELEGRRKKNEGREHPSSIPLPPSSFVFVCGWPIYLDEYSTWPRGLDVPWDRMDPMRWGQSGPCWDKEQYQQVEAALDIEEAVRHAASDCYVVRKRLEFLLPGVDLAFVQFSFADHLGHMGKFGPQLPEIAAIVRDVAAWALERAETVIVVSDHGFDYGSQRHELAGVWAAPSGIRGCAFNGQAAERIRQAAGIENKPAEGIEIPDVEPPDDKVLRDRLRALGYLE